MNLAHLKELHLLALEEAKKYVKNRFAYTKLQKDKGRHFLGIIGPRGVGKTILLKQFALEHADSFYLSTDTLLDEDLFEVVKQLKETLNVTTVLIDEIHFYQDFARALKKIYDFLPVKLIFTSSASLALHQSSLDLSRRVKFQYLYPFTFREYVFFKKDTLLPALSLNQILNKEWSREHLLHDYLLPQYLRGDLMPFSLEEADIFPLLKNILQKILYSDLPAIHDLRASEISSIEKMIRFISRSEVDGINYTSLSKNLGITKYKAELYVRLLQQAFVLNVVWPTGTNVLREPKILMYLPYRLLFRDFEEAIGGIREDFAVEMLRSADYPCYYLKSTRGQKTPDYLVETPEGDFVIEIGGKGKGRQQFKGIKVDRKLIFSHSPEVSDLKRPLVLLGYLK